MSGKTLTITGLALYMGWSKRSTYRMLNDGRFSVPPIPGMSPRRWNVEDVDAWRAVHQ
jgi:excisionase family DNA binding protein